MLEKDLTIDQKSHEKCLFESDKALKLKKKHFAQLRVNFQPIFWCKSLVIVGVNEQMKKKGAFEGFYNKLF